MSYSAYYCGDCEHYPVTLLTDGIESELCIQDCDVCRYHGIFVYSDDFPCDDFELSPSSDFNFDEFDEPEYL